MVALDRETKILNPEVTKKPGRWADIAAPVEELDATGHRSRHRGPLTAHCRGGAVCNS